jgi:hypothetical protein
LNLPLTGSGDESLSLFVDASSVDVLFSGDGFSFFDCFS